MVMFAVIMGSSCTGFGLGSCATCRVRCVLSGEFSDDAGSHWQRKRGATVRLSWGKLKETCTREQSVAICLPD